MGCEAQAFISSFLHSPFTSLVYVQPFRKLYFFKFASISKSAPIPSLSFPEPALFPVFPDKSELRISDAPEPLEFPELPELPEADPLAAISAAISSTTLASPSRRLITALFVVESALRYSCTSFFSVAVKVSTFGVLEEVFEDVFFAVEVFLAEEVFFAEAAAFPAEAVFPSPVAASSSDFCVTPRTFAIFLITSCTGSFSPRSTLPTSEAVSPSTCSAKAACVIPLAVRASLIKSPSFFDILTSLRLRLAEWNVVFCPHIPKQHKNIFFISIILSNGAKVEYFLEKQSDIRGSRYFDNSDKNIPRRNTDMNLKSARRSLTT